MPPETSRDFQRAAGQRLVAAETLLAQGLTLDAQYICGYVVECSLKALILHVAPEADRPALRERISRGERMHRAEVLLGELRELKINLPRELAQRLRRFDWTTDLRYETGRRDTGETKGMLKTAQAIMNWVEGFLS